MKEEIIQNINQGLEAAYINGNLASNLEYKPSFISNNPEEGKKVISSITQINNKYISTTFIYRYAYIVELF